MELHERWRCSITVMEQSAVLPNDASIMKCSPQVADGNGGWIISAGAPSGRTCLV